MCTTRPGPASAATYDRIADAIAYIRKNFRSQPSLDDMAAAAGVSRHHFHRLFSEWVGVSPKKFVQYLSIEYAKNVLHEGRASLLDTAYTTGLSGPGRLHDLFVGIESMTPGEFKNGGEALQINYRFSDSPFGRLIVASTPRGVCHLAFVGPNVDELDALRARFRNASFRESDDQFQRDALRIFRDDWSKLDTIKLHLKGTAFQLKVWECLLKIPAGRLATYGTIARTIGQPTASRAVGAAVGHNPVAFLIPCHRVIQAGGQLGGYRWGTTRKSAMVGWEAARSDHR